MGTWGVDTFGNDDACDWVYDLEETADMSLVEATLSRVVGTGPGYLESHEAAKALAAAEVLARMQGHSGEPGEYRQIIDVWVTNNGSLQPTEPLCVLAHAAIDRVLVEPSELLELWQESADFDDWKQAVLNLKSRIAIAAAP